MLSKNFFWVGQKNVDQQQKKKNKRQGLLNTACTVPVQHHECLMHLRAKKKEFKARKAEIWFPLESNLITAYDKPLSGPKQVSKFTFI